ncbi:MAG TPA: nucleotidyltransferase family protein [Candidatus Acidoferrum sp.]|nr:nucleotidyltransferase family protein [Candidatus Acidoferrum sp.]
MAAPISSTQSSHTASLGNEWSALLECASPARDPRQLGDLLRSVDWDRLLALAEDHGVEGHLASSIHEVEGQLVPAEVRQRLADRQRAQTFFTLRLNAELFRVLEQFSANGIGAVAIKGPVLAVQAYGDPAMRSYGDLDLLVRQREIRRASELMIARGFAAAVSLSAIDAGKIPGQYLFSKPDSRLLVELHNDLTLRYFPRRLPLEDFFARQIRVRVDAHDVPALSVEDELVLICIHGAKHFWERLMWVADVAALVSRQRDIDWERVADSSRAVGAEHMLHTGLRLASDLLKARLPSKVRDAVQADGIAARLSEQCAKWMPTAGNTPGLFVRAAFRLRMRGGLLSAPAYLLRLSFSPTEEDWKNDGAGSAIKFLDVVRRPFRLARKYGRDNKD